MRQTTRPAPHRLAIASIVGLAGVSLTALPGCIASGSSYTKAEGRYISNDTISRIEPGVTQRDWVLAVLGDPTSKSTLSDGREIWKWSSKTVSKSSGSVFLLVHGSNREVTERTVYVELEGDTVLSAWKD